MKKVFIIFLLFFLFFSGCAVGTHRIETEDTACTCAGSETGTMSWDVNGAIVRPSLVGAYYGKDTFSTWYYGEGNLNVCNDVVYTGGDRLTAIDLKTGKELWETQLKNSSPNENALTFILFPTIYKDKIVAVGARLVVEKGSDYYFERRNLLVFDRKTGKLLWKSVDIGSKNQYFDAGFPVILNNKIYVPALNGEYRAAEPGHGHMSPCKEEERGIWVWDINTGRLLDKIILKFPEGYSDPGFSSVITDGRTIYISAGVLPAVGKTLHPTYIIAYNPERNKVIWKMQIADTLITSDYDTFAVNNKVIIKFCNINPTKSHGPKDVIKAINKKTGKMLWSKEVRAVGKIALTEDRVFAQTSRGTVTCFDALTGREIWSYKYHKPSNTTFYGHPRFTPFLARNVLYLVDSHVIIALNPDSGQELWSIIPPCPKTVDKETEDFNGSWRFIPVNNGFVTLHTVFAMSGSMISPPFVRLWLDTSNKK